MDISKLCFVSSFVFLSLSTGCTSGSSGSNKVSNAQSNDNVSFEQKAADASRFNLTLVNPATIKALNSSDATQWMAVDGQVLLRSDAEASMKSKGATACGFIYRGFTFAAGDNFRLTEAQAGLLEGSENTHQLVLIHRDGSQNTLAIYCAKLATPVALADIRAALRGIITITYE